MNPVKIVRVMDYCWPVDSSSLCEDEGDRLVYAPFGELFKIKTVTKFSYNKSSQVSTVCFDDVDPYFRFLSDSISNAGYLCEFLESLGHINAYYLSQCVKSFLNKVLGGSNINLMA